MNEAEIAHKILNRRNSLCPVVMVGEMQQALGADGYALALERRWIEPNWDSGELSISDRPGVLSEMRALASTVKAEPVAETKPNNLYRLFSNNQQQRVIVQTPGGLVETFQPVTAPKPAGDPTDTQIGDEVVVAEDGKPYTGVVQSKNQDGSYVLSFGNDKPRTVRTYKSEELRKTSDAPTGSKPAPAVVPQNP